MKKLLAIILVAAGTISTPGCKNFLDLAPKNQRTVSTIGDAKSLLANYLRSVAELRMSSLYGGIMPVAPAAANTLFESYSDNIDFELALTQTYLQPNNYHLKLEQGYADVLLWNNFSVPTTLWTNNYSIIGFMNALIDQMDEITDGTQQQRDQLLGEMKAHRAYYFFKLLQYFAPYHKAEQGIPVYLHTGKSSLGISVPRKTHAEVYKTILDDLHAAMEMIDRSAPLVGYNVFYNKRYLNHLLAQVYWFKAESPAKESSDYANVKKHATAAIDGAGAAIPTTVTGFHNAYTGKDPNYPALCGENNTQGGISFIYGANFQYLSPGTYGPENIPLAQDFAALFTPGDVRIALFFNMDPSRAGGKVGVAGRTLNWGWPTDGSANGTRKPGNSCIFKPEEGYLLLAEAQFRLNETGDAVTTLNQFKAFRNAGTATGLTGDALLQEIINERRKEFFGDSDKRWLDLKRYRNKTLNRKMVFFQKPYDITVAPDAYQYALPIPQTEVQENPALVPNDGWIPIEY
ncbi:RagB/SusD family nutrient uptake outer membrane protein [Chitinophaga horti]|uniref:RagB/SusD family nutrient uptake outer membrane protein n=1 Tax=Chitinophaga horti TaxID=2920382 RepID=A0ABY6J6U5_9BACT|nr:RagB/SusD family nutrient uptake outer membrane protein [Chitinophaga horti]UYQ95391.1 RagB/SusD family nutrient uptake outer membrane protein [Chitinophaga horti]